ncbi:uncharacterized protein MONBRDRAFT_33264 [Monosiga brevicollis MX1]|uniref:PID domain-containing protein n=1 Tax=Monosiga brevicollis TaxID=81824 RepID=A9V4F8_MONBE|nr:uncharacterized protein MONBRDRAFT_33264 [Monosiga brevicollis MX1]EDQ87608.1 predicted protein [Monosiga brevicollis MX1]|eukprot:XP_001747528.1 hypothetical protein [Monosiga brevicollis MX1]
MVKMAAPRGMTQPATAYFPDAEEPSTLPVSSPDDPIMILSPELLGSARLPPMSSQERQQYIDGFTIKAKYVGTIEVPESRGEQMAITAINRVRAAHKASKEQKQRVWLAISTAGLKIMNFSHYTIQDSYALSQISYTTLLPSNPQVFSVVTANTSVQPPVYKCHVFKSKSRSREITTLLGRCFSIELEEQRKRIQERSQYASRAATPQGGARSRAATSSAGYRPVQPRSRASTLNGSGGSSSFPAIVSEIHRKIEQLPINSADSAFLQIRLDQLSDLYTHAQNRLEETQSRLMHERSLRRQSQA